MHCRMFFSATTRLLMLAALVAPLGGCFGPRNFLNENDKLRAENLALREAQQQFEKTLQLREDHIRRLEQQLEAAGAAPAQGVPRLTSIQFAKLSGLVDTDGDEQADILRLYLRTLDQQGRFMPVAGEAAVQLVAIAPDAGVREIAAAKYDREGWNSAYRSGLTGTHYTLELPVPQETQGDLTVKVTFKDADTGATISAQQAVGEPAT